MVAIKKIFNTILLLFADFKEYFLLNIYTQLYIRIYILHWLSFKDFYSFLGVKF